jgi:hypothetical protein
MEIIEEFAIETGSKPARADVPVVGLASAVAVAAATSLLGFSMLPAGKRRLSISSQVGLGVLAICAAALVWIERQEEAAVARRLITHIDHVRDDRWLRKNPIDFG